MHAVTGDTIAVPGHTVGQAGRLGMVVGVRGEDGHPPYLIRWEDGHEGLCFPGPEARVLHEGQLDLG